MGKGSKDRTSNREAYRTNFDKVFRKPIMIKPKLAIPLSAVGTAELRAIESAIDFIEAAEKRLNDKC